MIGIADWTSRDKNLCQDLLALFERDAPQVVAVDVDEIEDVVQHGDVAATADATSMLADAGALLHQAERCTALFVEGDNFAIKNCGDGLNKFGELMQLRILSGQIVLIARNQADAAVFDEGDGAIAIPLNLEQVFRIVEGLFDGDGQHGVDGGRHWALGSYFQFFNHRGHRGHRGIILVGGSYFRYSITFITASTCILIKSHSVPLLPGRRERMWINAKSPFSFLPCRRSLKSPFFSISEASASVPGTNFPFTC